jgi:phosphate transport system permease protein
MMPTRPLYARRRVANVGFIMLSVGAAIFGLIWLALILAALLEQGFRPDVARCSPKSTPPPGIAKGGLLNAISAA